jgi:ABC-2 type transport system permease protein
LATLDSTPVRRHHLIVMLAFSFVMRRLRAAPVSPAGVLLAFALGTIACVAIGVFLGAVLPNAQAAQAVGLLLFFLSEMTSGVGPPREVLPDTMRQAALALPLTHVAISMQDPWIGRGSSLAELWIVAAIAIVCAALAYRSFRWE